MHQKIFSPQDAVKNFPILGSVGHLANLRSQKRGPRFYRLNRKIFYRLEDIEQYLFQCPVLTIDSVEGCR